MNESAVVSRLCRPRLHARRIDGEARRVSTIVRPLWLLTATPEPEAFRLPEGPRDTARTRTSRERSLLWLAYVEGESHDEIAASLGLGRRSIKVLLFRAKGRLRELLKARGVAGTP